MLSACRNSNRRVTQRFWLIWARGSDEVGKGHIYGSTRDIQFIFAQEWPFFSKELHVFIFCVFVTMCASMHMHAYTMLYVVLLAGIASLLVSWVLGSRLGLPGSVAGIFIHRAICQPKEECRKLDRRDCTHEWTEREYLALGREGVKKESK